MNQLLFDDLGLYEARGSQASSGLAILPLFRVSPVGHAYISLHAALQQELIVISELSEGGSVPELRVTNKGKLPVLILDGEELRGAKQNRVLNSSVLVPALSDLVIPVSCTESGRWNYQSSVFQESGNIMTPSSRSSKMEDVSWNLAQSGEHRSNQSKVWDNISEMQVLHHHQSPTSAMSDVFEAKKESMDEISGAFPLLEGQCGIYAEIGGKFAGIDLVSLPEIWSDLHAKIVRSYALDVLRHPREQKPLTPEKLTFLWSQLKNCKFSDFPAVGLGKDIRFEKPDLIGSLLAWEDCVAHFAAYPKLVVHTEEKYHSPRHRSAFDEVH